MRITHIQSLFSVDHGGPTQSLRHIVKAQAGKHQVSLRVLDGFPGAAPCEVLDGGIDQMAFQVDWPWRMGASKGLKRQLRADPTPDIYHLHGTWHRAPYYGAVEARRRRCPYILELYGSYDAPNLQWKPVRKWVFRLWFQDRVLRSAACLHVNSENEGKRLRQMGFSNPIAVVPGPINFASLSSLSAQRPRLREDVCRFVLYLARIDRKKGIEYLIEAWAHVAPKLGGMQLVIAGPGELASVQHYQSIVLPSPVANSVHWLGRVSEEEKVWLYRNACLYVLPSANENFGNTIAEALACGTPVITTKHTPWECLETHRCGWWINRDTPTLVDTLLTACSLDGKALDEMGRRGAALVRERFSLDSVAASTDALYGWCLGGARPDHLLIV